MVGLKIKLFELMEWAVSTLKQTTTQPCAVLSSGDMSHSSHLWVYVSTIGELNALTSLLTRLQDLYPSAGLVLLTDHPHYLEAFKYKYPDATVVSHGENGGGIQTLFARFPPVMLLLAEIPMRMFDAPCRLSFKVLHYCRQHGGRIFVVNGWLYGEQPTCTMERLENSLFADHYSQGIDAYMLQRAEDLGPLKTAGIAEEKLHLTGNLKFDNLLSKKFSSLNKSEVYTGTRTLLVCGCVTNISEQQLILATYQRLKSHLPELLCVLAPRHPENSERMQLLSTMLEDAGLSFALRTAQQQPLAIDVDVLILDTFGELQDFYQLSDICYVGLNHNLLEPLSFLKPTYVTPGWESRYPSYPVYRTLLDKDLIVEAQAATAESLAAAILTETQPFKTYIEPSSELGHELNFEQRLLHKIKDLSGTLDQNLDIIQAALSQRSAPTAPARAPVSQS